MKCRFTGEATPVMIEGRMARAELREARDRLGKAVAEERPSELEIELVGERERRCRPARIPETDSTGRMRSDGGRRT